jgi:hypothetical protein
MTVTVPRAILVGYAMVGIFGAVAIGSSQEMAFLLEPPCADDAYVNLGQVRRFACPLSSN